MGYGGAAYEGESVKWGAVEVGIWCDGKKGWHLSSFKLPTNVILHSLSTTFRNMLFFTDVYILIKIGITGTRIII